MQRSFATGVLPKVWKTSAVTLIFKKGDSGSNYRPISLTPIVAKIMERISPSYDHSDLITILFPKNKTDLILGDL